MSLYFSWVSLAAIGNWEEQHIKPERNKEKGKTDSDCPPKLKNVGKCFKWFA
jgi:hypothetical protein